MIESDTIAAISTPVGEGGIAIIRVSGPEAIEIVDKIYKGKRALTEVDGHTIHYGHIVRLDDEGDILDEVMVSVMKKPNSSRGRMW